MTDGAPELRVGDADRRVVDDRLMAAVGEGQLTLREYDERAGQLWQARTRSELDVLTADLPTPVTSVRRDSAGDVRARHVVAVMSEDRFDEPLLPGQEVRSYAVMGKSVIDLRRDDLAEHVRVTAWSVMGEIEVLVPPDATVHLSGVTVMGERKVTVAGGSGPVIDVFGVAVMGAVKVHAGDGRMLAARGSTTRTGRSGSAQPARREAAIEPAAQRPGPLRRLARRVGGLTVPLVLVGGLVLAGPDGVSIFGSREVQAQAGESISVSVLFGSVKVVVPDGVRVETSGVTIFGSVSCQDACTPTPAGGGQVVRVRSVGGFGSVSIKTAAEASVGDPDN